MNHDLFDNMDMISKLYIFKLRVSSSCRILIKLIVLKFDQSFTSVNDVDL